jgi:hypothetical protein
MRRRARSGLSNRETQPLRPDQKKYGDAETLLVRGSEEPKQRQARQRKGAVVAPCPVEKNVDQEAVIG